MEEIEIFETGCSAGSNHEGLMHAAGNRRQRLDGV